MRWSDADQECPVQACNRASLACNTLALGLGSARASERNRGPTTQFPGPHDGPSETFSRSVMILAPSIAVLTDGTAH